LFAEENLKNIQIRFTAAFVYLRSNAADDYDMRNIILESLKRSGAGIYSETGRGRYIPDRKPSELQ